MFEHKKINKIELNNKQVFLLVYFRVNHNMSATYNLKKKKLN